MVATSVLDTYHVRAQLTARPRHLPVVENPPTGDLTIAGTRVYVPECYSPDAPAALLVMLHGAGGTAGQSLAICRSVADACKAIIVAPKSRRATWYAVRPGFGHDVATIDRALAAVFDSYAVDPERIAIGGFSDGASYALSLGLANGSLFTTIVAFSPGFTAHPTRTGRPRVFISHGRNDRVLPISCARHVLRELSRLDLDVELAEFDGGHTIPDEMLTRGFERWLVD